MSHTLWLLGLWVINVLVLWKLKKNKCFQHLIKIKKLRITSVVNKLVKVIKMYLWLAVDISL